MPKEKEGRGKMSLPKWLLQGFFYGIFLALIGYIVGSMAANILPGVFPANFPALSASLGFIASIGIAYTRDITS